MSRIRITTWVLGSFGILVVLVMLLVQLTVKLSRRDNRTELSNYLSVIVPPTGWWVSPDRKRLIALGGRTEIVFSTPKRMSLADFKEHVLSKKRHFAAEVDERVFYGLESEGGIEFTSWKDDQEITVHVRDENYRRFNQSIENNRISAIVFSLRWQHRKQN